MMTSLRATTVLHRIHLLTGLMVLLCTAWVQGSSSCPEGLDMIYFDPAPPSQDVMEGDDLLIRCDVSSRQLIVFYWTLNGKTLVNTSRRFQESSDLRILRVNRVLDAGGFRCVAVNVCTGIALRSAEARLTIQWLSDQVAVKRMELENNGTMSETKDVTLKCQVDANPEPTFEWFRNKIKLFTNDHFQLAKNRARMLVATTSDNGVYSCRARNAAGQAESLENFVLNAAGDDSVPRLIEETFTRVVVARKYSSATFDCQFEAGVVSQWYLHQLHLANTTKYYIVSNGSLIINHVDEDDAGAYRCIGTSASNASINQVFTAELHLAYLNNMTESSFDPRSSPGHPHIIPVGGKMEVRCFPPKGLPAPTSRWLVPSGSVPPSGGRIKESPDGVITIARVEEADAGAYVCQVENLAGIRSLSFNLVVSVTPRITKPPLSQSVLEGDRVTLECRFYATPYPATTVSWRKTGQPIDSTIVRFHSNQGNLTINDVQVIDEGEYSCVVTSKGHSAVSSQSARLRVSKRLKFCAKPSDAKLDLNSDRNVSCCADGTMPPDISWQKIGGALPSRVRFDKTGNLFFTGVQRSDAGLYVCLASNNQGAINATIRVDVVVKPAFTLKSGNVTTKDGVPVMLHCRASGEPLPTIRWERMDRVEPFDLPRIKVLENGTLFISNVFMEDAGSYRCVADNGAGQVQLDVYLGVDDDVAEVGKSENRMMRTIVIALCCAAGYLGIMIALLVYCVIRRMRRRQATPANNGNGCHVNESTQLMFKKDKEIVSSRSNADSRSQSSSQNSHQLPRTLSFHPVNDLAPFPRQNLQIFGLLGKCSYGDVMLAHNLNPGTVCPLVSVKSLMSPAGPFQAEFQREMELIARANHVNVARLIGICCSLQPPILIIEYCEWGDLKQFLMSLNTESSRVLQSTLSLAQQLEMVYQVARGMEHLSLNHLFHGDLAARNILVAPSLDLKITSLSLSRDIHAGDYFLFHNQLVPLRWMPAESVFNSELSTTSDVWSFGVLALEVFRFGALPLPGKSNDEILIGLKAGANLHCLTPLPQYGCPEGLWRLVQRCTSPYPVDRPTFTEIVNALGNLVADSGV